MFWMRPGPQSSAAWQAVTDRAVEAGETPLLDLGCVDAAVLGLTGMATVAEAQPWPLAAEPPLAVAGGTSPLWLAVCLRPRALPTVDLLFGGADAATHMASLNLMDGAQRSPLTRDPVRLPTGYWRDLAPPRQPAAAAPWEALPALAAEDALANQATAAGSGHGPSQLDGWIAWTALGLSLFLVVLALLL